jgi:RimJ/RimL family protein N-acetyltransferase
MTAIAHWTRRDRSAIERWPTEDLPAHWRVIEESQAPSKRQQFAVTAICDGTLIGRIALRDISNGCARIGIVIHPHRRGQGLGTDALIVFTVVAQGGLRLAALRLDVAADNWAARRTYAKAGFVEIGHVDRHGHRYIEMARAI